MIYVLYGNETFLLEQKLKDLKEKYNISEEMMNLVVYDDPLVQIKDVIEDCNTPPFLSEYKMVVLKNPIFLTTQKIPEKNKQDLSVLEDYLSKPFEQTVFVIFSDVKNFDERKKIVKRLKKEAVYVTLDELSEQQLTGTIRQAIKKRKCLIEDDAMELLLSRVEHQLIKAMNEVEKLTLYTSHIKIEDVKMLVSKPIEENAFELVSAIMKKKQTLAIQIYKDLMIKNEEPVKLIVMIANQMRLLYQVKVLDRKGYNDQEIAKILAINPYRIKYLRQDARYFELDDLLAKLNDLACLDKNIKQGLVEKRLGLELFLMKV
ncbi:MAG: DNA polymerase III subunit delta [Erysipelotrichaceae bacterium]|nr:DNA polymerase III subunit delta [Erysipelotrichaceae bacterium]